MLVRGPGKRHGSAFRRHREKRFAADSSRLSFKFERPRSHGLQRSSLAAAPPSRQAVPAAHLAARGRPGLPSGQWTSWKPRKRFSWPRRRSSASSTSPETATACTAPWPANWTAARPGPQSCGGPPWSSSRSGGRTVAPSCRRGRRPQCARGRLPCGPRWLGAMTCRSGRWRIT